jgi:transcriptional regulator with XRE-family HTH domain
VISSSAIATYWGNVSPYVKEHFPREPWNYFPMAIKRPAPRYVLAENLRVLIEVNKTTAPRVAEKAGIDRKSVNNMLNARFNPDLDNVEAVANVFGLTSWQLLRRDLKDALVKAGVVEELIDNFYKASEDGRAKIMGIAEMAANYKPASGADK